MDETKKTICKLCGQECTSIAHHLINAHKHECSTKDYYDRFMKKSEEGICKACGKETSFVKLSIGYRDYCSTKCSTSSKEVQQKAKETYKERTGYTHTRYNPEAEKKLKETNLKKYGKEYYFATKESKEAIKETNLERYGTEHALQNKEVLEKVKQTNLERYGVENVFANEEIKEKIYATNLERYGVKIATQNPEIQKKGQEKLDLIKDQTIQKARITRKLRNNERFAKFFEKYNYKHIDFDGVDHKFICDKDHNTKINRSTLMVRVKNDVVICPKCNPFISGFSKAEKDLLEFIKENYKGTIEENSKRCINPLEIDIYLPDLKLAFEYNGLFWHNELNKDNNYHFEKTERCEHKDITLIQVYEDDWFFKKEIVQSRILNLLGKSQKIFARKCTIKEVSTKDSREFLNRNHIQGFVFSETRLGLYFQDELVSLMTFSEARFKNKDSVELVRFCNKLGYNVVGGASKLFKHFLKTLPSGTGIVSYADRSWSRGKLYKTLGFDLVSKTVPNYHYVVDFKREDRFKYTKKNLVKQGFDSTKTEHQIMLDREIFRVYNSGSFKFKFVKP